MGRNQASNEVKISNKICGCRFRFDESMLMVTEFGLKWYEICSCMIDQVQGDTKKRELLKTKIE